MRDKLFRRNVILILAIFLMVGCVGASEPASGPGTTFTDMAGNDVTLPESVDRVIITSMSPMVPIYVYYTNSTDKLIGANSAGITYALSGAMSKIYPGLKNVNTGFVQGVDINIEEILKLKPDVVIYTGSRKDEYDILSKANLTTVGFTTSQAGTDNNVFNQVEKWLRQLSNIVGDTGKADQLIAYNNEVQEKVAEKIDTVTEDNKPKALIIFSYKDGKLQVAGSGHYSDYWLNATGAENVAADITGLKEVDMEQVIAWDPEIIYFANSQSALPSDLYNNTIPGSDWSSVSAVKNKQVYIFPYATYMSYAPSLENGLVLQWMAKINHPELFKDLDMTKETESFFEKFFNYTATDEDIKGFLNPEYISVRLH